MLITGPGDGLDLAGPASGSTPAAAPAVTGQTRRERREARDRSIAVLAERSAARAMTATPALARGGAGGAGGRGAGGRGGRGGSGLDGMIGSVPPSPELLARVAALPPIKDKPKVDIAQARAADYNFTLGKLLKPILAAVIFGSPWTPSTPPPGSRCPRSSAAGSTPASRRRPSTWSSS